MTVTITAVPEYPPGLLPRIALTVITTPATTAPIDLVRIHQDGTEHRVIVSNREQVIGGGWADKDYHAPFNQQVTYRVRTGADQATAQAFVSMDVPWLISADEPDLSFPIRVKQIGDRTRDPRAAAHRPVGGQLIAISDDEHAWDGVVSSLIIQVEDEAPLQRLIDDSPVVLINTPGAGWRIQWMWALLGQLTYVNAGRAYWQSELITLPVTEVAAPDVDLVSTWNAGVMASTFAAQGKTAGDIVGLYANSLALLTDTRL